MNLHENGGIEHHRHRGFDVDNTEASIRELELQLERGEISSNRYLEKKAALVSIFLKATTRSTRRRRRSYESDDY